MWLVGITCEFLLIGLNWTALGLEVFSVSPNEALTIGGTVPTSFSAHDPMQKLSLNDTSKPKPADTVTVPLSGGAVSTDSSRYTPQQDTVYSRAKRQHITPRIRFRNDLAHTNPGWNEEQKVLANQPESIMMRNLAMREEELQPTGQEIINHARQYSPGIAPDYIPNISQAGVSIPFSLGGLLGYPEYEDVSPEISYTVHQPADVRIVIYSVKGDAVAHPLDTFQSSGSHSYTWGGRDDSGNDLPHGDYIAEIYIGSAHIVRKHVKI